MPYRYSDFIDDIKALSDEPAQWSEAEACVTSPKFAAWHREMDHALLQASREGYPGKRANFVGRDFGRFLRAGGPQERDFAAHLEATLHEVRIVARDFERSGEPSKVGKARNEADYTIANHVAASLGRSAMDGAAVPAPPIQAIAAPVNAGQPTWPEKMSPSYLFTHMPLSSWFALGGLLVTFFAGGFWFASAPAGIAIATFVGFKPAEVSAQATTASPPAVKTSGKVPAANTDAAGNLLGGGRPTP